MGEYGIVVGSSPHNDAALIYTPGKGTKPRNVLTSFFLEYHPPNTLFRQPPQFSIFTRPHTFLKHR